MNLHAIVWMFLFKVVGETLKLPLFTIWRQWLSTHSKYIFGKFLTSGIFVLILLFTYFFLFSMLFVVIGQLRECEPFERKIVAVWRWKPLSRNFYVSPYSKQIWIALQTFATYLPLHARIITFPMFVPRHLELWNYE